MSADEKLGSKVALRLTEAAELIRVGRAPIANDPLGMALADWLSAEADHYQRMSLQAAALNFLIATSDGSGDLKDWRVQVGYATTEQALALTDQILGDPR